MIKALRKKHLQIWTLWCVLIPIGIISAVLVRPEFPKDKLLQPTTTVVLPMIIKSVNNDNYTINIRSNSDTSQLQLEWINKKTLTYPTATIYQTASPKPFGVGVLKDFTTENSELIGRIEARGAYHFELKKNSNKYYFILYDFIHQQVIDSITL